MRQFLLSIALLGAITTAMGQEAATSLNINYTTEGLYNATTNKANWINLLNVEATQRLWRNATLSLDLLSVDNLRNSKGKEGVADDLNVFSAIEDGSVALSLFMFGITQRFGPVDLFFGVRNVNNDYFTSPWNSVFTGSTNGLLPVISHGYPLSDSPLSAMCLHLDWEIIKNLRLKSSLYNGVAGSGWDERFRIRPERDGVLNISEVSYTSDTEDNYLGNYHFGVVYGYVPEVAGGRKVSTTSFWTLIEQPIYRSAASKTLALLVQAGGSPRCVCDAYLGGGVVWRGLFGAENYLGALVNRTWHDQGNETALELTYSFTKSFVTIQPALHQIFSPRRNQTIAMLKVSFDIGFSLGEK